MSPHRETRDPLGPRVRVNYVSADAYIILEMTSAQCLQNQLQHQLQRQVIFCAYLH